MEYPVGKEKLIFPNFERDEDYEVEQIKEIIKSREHLTNLVSGKELEAKAKAAFPERMKFLSEK